jgi:voltage-gated potassium channel
LVTIMGREMKDHVVVCGLGHVGFRVLQELRALGEEVIAIERKEGDFVELARGAGMPVKIGDARVDALLEEIGIPRAKAVVCATDDDLANLEIALDAKRMNPNIRVVMRMFDQRLAAKVGGALELEQSFSSAGLAAPLVAMQATVRGVRAAYRLGETLRVTAEARIGKSSAKITVSELEERASCRIVAIQQGEKSARTARGAESPDEGDIAIIDAAATDLARARSIIAQ